MERIEKEKKKKKYFPLLVWFWKKLKGKIRKSSFEHITFFSFIFFLTIFFSFPFLSTSFKQILSECQFLSFVLNFLSHLSICLWINNHFQRDSKKDVRLRKKIKHYSFTICLFVFFKPSPRATNFKLSQFWLIFYAFISHEMNDLPLNCWLKLTIKPLNLKNTVSLDTLHLSTTSKSRYTIYIHYILYYILYRAHLGPTKI